MHRRTTARACARPSISQAPDPETALASVASNHPARHHAPVAEPSFDAKERREALVTFLTTEHFTLQTARAASIAETNSRLQLYLGVLSSSILALALIAQVAEFTRAFFVVALILFLVVFFLGLATIGRLGQTWLEWFHAGQGMSRIRRYFVDVAPEAERYLILPAHDDPWSTLRGAGIRGMSWTQGFYTAFAIIAVINSVVAGAIGALVGALFADGSIVVSSVAGGATFLGAGVASSRFGARRFRRNVGEADIRFPAEDTGAPV